MFVRFICDLFVPPSCPLCFLPQESSDLLCVSCWQTLDFITESSCVSCGLPFEVGAFGMTCGACFADPPVFAAHRSAAIYKGAMRRLILGFKHGDKLHYRPLLTHILRRAFSCFPPESSIDLIASVPSDLKRLLKRNYNPAAFLASDLAGILKKSYHADFLKRIGHISQKNMSKEQRLKNTEKAFIFNPLYHSAVKGKSVLIVDDVYTTGATLKTCCKILEKNGAKAVFALTLARVIL